MKPDKEKDDISKFSEYFPEKGERAISIGQTGSGKTTFNRWLLDRLPDSPTVVYDTKHDPKFNELKNNRVVHTMSQAQEAIDDLSVDYIIIRPPPRMIASPQSLDLMLEYHEANWHGIDAYIDELIHFHSGGRAFAGMTGLFTRGRSRGITTIGSTQRPAWVSGFIFSEAQLFYLFYLGRKSDKKRVDDFIDGYDRMESPRPPAFHAFRQGSMKPPELMPAVPVADIDKLGYTDHLKSAETADSEAGPDEKPRGPHVWI